MHRKQHNRCKLLNHNMLKLFSELKNPTLNKPDFLISSQIIFSKQLQLLPWGAGLFNFFVVKNLHTAELLVSNAHYPNLSVFWQRHFHPFYMHIGVFHTCAMPQINRKLEHRKTVVQKFLPELRRGFPFLFRISRQIEKHQNPHNPIFAESVHVRFPWLDMPFSAILQNSICKAML